MSRASGTSCLENVSFIEQGYPPASRLQMRYDPTFPCKEEILAVHAALKKNSSLYDIVAYQAPGQLLDCCRLGERETAIQIEGVAASM